MIFGGYKFHGVHGLVCLLVTLILMWLWFIKNITNSELGIGVTEWIPPVRVLSPLLTPKSVPTSTMKTTIEDFEQKINLPFLNPEKIKSPILDSKKSSEFLEDVKHWIKDKESQRPMQLGPKPHGYASMPLYTACDYRLNRSREAAVKRWPDAIAIGVAKCGTGSLTFIDCHSKFTFRHYEPNFYGRVRPAAQRNLQSYNLPDVLADEILIEKSPEYMAHSVSSMSGRAKMMKEDNPNLKLIIFFCDPVKRTYSHVNQILAMSKFQTGNVYTEVDASECMKLIVNGLPTSEGGSLNCGSFHGIGLNMAVERSNYMTTITPWLQHFNLTDIHLIDGSNLVTNPKVEFDLISKFFNQSSELQFKYNEVKGFDCLDEPTPQCLEASKGRSWKKGSREKITVTYASEFAKLEAYFHDEMMRFHELLSTKFPKNTFNEGRFEWLNKYSNKSYS